MPIYPPFLWHGCMHGNICGTHQVDGVNELKQQVWRGLGQCVINDTMDERHKRLWTCIHAKRGHFEHLV